MKKKLIPISIILIVLIVGIFGVIYYKNSKSNLKETKSDEVIKTSESKKENITEETKKQDTEKKEDKKDETVPPKEEKQKETKKENNNSSSQKQQTTTTNTPSQTPQNNTQQTAPQNNVVQEQPQVQEPVRNSGPWDAWGMTEDQYYNQPMHSWERVDFGSMNECLNYGDNYAPYLNGEVLYNCREVTSASGKFLGVMFDTEKLN